MKTLIINSPKYGIKEVLIDAEDFEKVSKYKWYVKETKYTTYVKTTNRKKILLHRFILGLTDSNIHVDHINGNGLDNRKINIRPCSPADNCKNKRPLIGLTSKYKGVFKRDRPKPYCCQISINGKALHLGSFKTELEAAQVYNNAALKYYGEFANLNVL